MNIPRRYVRTATVLTIALATGHLMQNSGAIAARLGVADPDPVAAPAATIAGPQTQVALLSTPRLGDATALDFLPGDLGRLPDERAPQRLAQPGQHLVASLDTANDVTPVAPQAPQATPDCTARLDASAGAAASVTLALTAPCQPNAEVTIGHAGLTFRDRTDASGALVLSVPVLQADARFTVTVAGAPEMQAEVQVPSLADFDRVAVTWRGPADLQLHAFEFGASYDAEGHVWRGHPRAAADAAHGEGFLQALGAADAMAPVRTEVYTFPAGHSPRAGVVGLTLEAQVTDQSCGRDSGGPHRPVDRRWCAEAGRRDAGDARLRCGR